MREAGIYVHIPFCIKKCNYCDFNSYELKGSKEPELYFQALKRDWAQHFELISDCRIKSIYFGGGTPSIIPGRLISGLLSCIAKRLSFRNNPEITLEMNPATCTQSKLKAYRAAGVNRISLGVQSFDDGTLKLLGRAHSAEASLKTVALLRKTGFDNISMDLIYGIPGQTLEQWHRSIDIFISLGLEHLSFYDLKIEKGTPFYRVRKKLRLADESLQIKMYQTAAAVLKKNGYLRYEISSFSRQDKASVHNQIYWRNGEYLGLGAGAFSYLRGERFSRVRGVKKYIAQTENGRLRRYGLEKLENERMLRETIILNLRRMEGFRLSRLEDRCAVKAGPELISGLNMFSQEGLLKNKGDNYRLTSKGILLYDSVAAELL